MKNGKIQLFQFNFNVTEIIKSRYFKLILKILMTQFRDSLEETASAYVYNEELTWTQRETWLSNKVARYTHAKLEVSTSYSSSQSLVVALAVYIHVEISRPQGGPALIIVYTCKYITEHSRTPEL